MKKFLFFIALTITVFVVSSCNNGENNNNFLDCNRFGMRYDTLLIHGNKHEIIEYPIYAGHGYMHSPECWCLKKKYNQESSDDYYSDLDDEDIEECND